VKIGIVSDVHGEVAALELALGHIHRMDCDMVLCAGDLVCFEPFGDWVIQVLKAEKVICISGDREHRTPDGDPPESCEDGTELSRQSLAWVAALPVRWSAVLEGVRVAMWQDAGGVDVEAATAAMRRRLLAEAGTDVLVVGGAQGPFDLAAGAARGKIVSPGPCRARLSPAVYRCHTFGVLELPSTQFTVFRALDGEQVRDLAGDGIRLKGRKGER
jgi:predicted phosphodiesterase